MLINTFADSKRDKTLTFTSNGDRQVYFKIPERAILKSAHLELEGHSLIDRRINRIGVVTVCSLEELNILEDQLESTSYNGFTTKQGWGFEPDKLSSDKINPDQKELSDNFAVIPIDPGTLADASPGYYTREFDLVVIPNGNLNFSLANLISSGIPIVTMNPAVAIELGLGSSISLDAGVRSVHITDDNNYITGQLINEFIQLEDLKIIDNGKNKKNVHQRSPKHILITALDVTPENTKVIIDTGIEDQGIIIIDMRHKYGYFGFLDISQVITNPDLFNLFHLMIEWAGIGGRLTNIGYDIGEISSRWRKLGIFNDCVATPDFAGLIQKYLETSSILPEPDGGYLVPLSFYSDSPGILKINEVRLNCAFIEKITTFTDGASSRSLTFDGINIHQSLDIALPKTSRVINATLKIDDRLTNERMAICSVNELNMHGVMISPEYIVAQEFKIDRYLPITRVSLNLTKVKDDTELRLELWLVDENIKNGNFVKANDQDLKVEGNILTELITSAPISAADLNDNYSWVDIQVQKIILKPDACYWLVLRPVKGEALWHADDECPNGGLLRSSRNNGRKWYSHKMDGLFKIYFETELLTPTLVITPGQNCQAPELESVELELNLNDPDRLQSNLYPKIMNITGLLNDYLSKYNKYGSKISVIPLIFTSECIGSLKISDLEIECEVASLELNTEFDRNSVSVQLKSIIENLNTLRSQVNAIYDRLPADILMQKLKIQ
jgi:hypothetical protein